MGQKTIRQPLKLDLSGITANTSSAILEVNSTTQGILLPRMTNAQMIAIPSPAIGLLVYQTDSPSGLYQYNGSAWVRTISQFDETSTTLTTSKILRAGTLGTSALLGRTPTLGTDGDFQFALLSNNLNGGGQGLIFNGYAAGNLFIPTMDITNKWSWWYPANRSDNYMFHFDGNPIRTGNLPLLNAQFNSGIYCFTCIQDVTGLYCEGYFSVSGSGVPSNLVFTKPSSDTSKLNVAIVTVSSQSQVQITSTWYVTTTLRVEPFFVASTEMPFLYERNSSTGLAKYWTGSEGFGVGHTSQNASAIFQVDSTTKGFLPPRMTYVQMTGITTPATGLLVYQTDSPAGLYQYNGSAWVGFGNLSGSGLTTNKLLTFNGTNIVSVPGMELNATWGQMFGYQGTAGSNGRIFSVLDSGGSTELLTIRNDGAGVVMNSTKHSFSNQIIFDKTSTNLIQVQATNTTSTNYIQGWLNSGQSIYGFRYSNTLVALWQSNDNTASTILQKWSNSSNTQIGVLQNDGLYFGTGTKSASAISQLDSTSQGFLPPRMTSTQRAGIITPATGLVVYQTDSPSGLYFFNGTVWSLLTSTNNIRQVDVQLFNYALQQDVSYADAGTITTFINLNNQLTSATYQKFTYSAGTWTGGSVTNITFTAGVSTVSIAMAQYDFIRVVGVLAGANTQAVLSIKTTIS